MGILRRMAGLVGFFFAVLFLAACASDAGTAQVSNKPAEQTEFLMGTYVTLRIYDEGKEDVLAEGFELVKDLADKITGETMDSEISAVNAAAGVEPVQVSPAVYEVIQIAHQYAEESEGKFNYAIGPITDLWRIGFDDARKPEQEEIDQALAKTDFRKVEFDDAGHSIYLPEAGMMLDLGAIAKGYMTDEVKDLFASEGVTTAVIDLGGNVFVMGGSPTRNGAEWNVGVQDPLAPRGQSLGKMKLKDRSIVTSGIYERYLEVDGVVYHHLMNPETGYPFDNEIIGVSIVSEQSVDGDALSTQVFGMGLTAGLAYVNSRADVEAVFITEDKGVYISDGLKGNFELTHDAYTLMNE